MSSDTPAEAMMEMREQLRPMMECAEGHRAEMQERGWSPQAAEQASLELYLGLMRFTFAGMAAIAGKQ